MYTLIYYAKSHLENKYSPVQTRFFVMLKIISVILLTSQQMFGFSNFDMASVTSIPRHITEDRKYHRSAWPKTPKKNRTEEW